MAEQASPTPPHYERQDTDSVADLPLKIPVSSIYYHFQCPICMSRIEEASITPCGHRFCFKCIDECINRQHKCPCCQTAVTTEELIRDLGFDDLLRCVREERSKAEKEYFQTLVQEATDAPFGAVSKLESPLQVVLQKHLKQSLHQHETYHQQLIMDYKRGLAKVEEGKQLAVQQAIREFPHDPDQPERVARMEDIERHGEEKKRALASELERVEILLASAYDRYLAENLPPPSTIPLMVKLTVPERKFEAREVLLKPTDNMATVLRKLKALMEKDGLEIVEFPLCDEFELSIISPFSPVKNTDGDLEEACGGGDGSFHDDSFHDAGDVPREKPQAMTLINQIVQPDCVPVLEYHIKPGTELRFKGNIVLEGDVPKLCFAATFVKGKGKSMDYYACQECNFNWVCRPCSEYCHKGHQLTAHVTNHKPTWACCYCPRKKTCGLQLS